MDSTGQIGKEPAAEEASPQSFPASSESLNDNVPAATSEICSGGIDSSEEGCLIDLTTEAACNISSSFKFISTDLGEQGTSHLDMKLWPLETQMNCIKMSGQSVTGVPGQSSANVLQDHFQLEHSAFTTAATNRMELDLKHRLSAATTSDHLGSHVENQEAKEKVALQTETKDACTIKKGSLDRTSDTDHKKTTAGRFSKQVDVGTEVHYSQHNPSSISGEAATDCNYQQLLSSVESSNITKDMRLVTAADSIVPHDEALGCQVASNDTDFVTCFQGTHKTTVPEQLEALSVSRPMFPWQDLYPASLNTAVSWSTELAQDKGWHESSPGSIMFHQSPAKLPSTVAAIDAVTETGISNCLIFKESMLPVPDPEHLAKDCSMSAAEDAMKAAAAAMPCLVSSPPASSLAIGSPLQLGCHHQLNMTPVPNVYVTGAVDHELSNRREPLLADVSRSLPVPPYIDSLQKSAEKRKALLCSTVNVYGHNQPRCCAPPPVNNNQPNINQSLSNSQPITCQTPVNSETFNCQSPVNIQAMTHQPPVNTLAMIHWSPVKIQAMTHQPPVNIRAMTHQPTLKIQAMTHRPPVNSQVMTHPSPVNIQAMTHQSSADIWAVTCPSSVLGVSKSSIPSLEQFVSEVSLPKQSPSSSLFHNGPGGHECPNMMNCSTCVQAFSKQLSLSLALDAIHHRTAAAIPLIPSKQPNVSYDKDQTTPYEQS